MTKKNFITLLLSTVGGILFALGMCMAMIPEWNTFTQGVVVGCIGLVVLIIMLLVRRKHGRQIHYCQVHGKDYRYDPSQYCRYCCAWFWYVSGYGLEQYGTGHCAGYCWNCIAAVSGSSGKGLEVNLHLDGNGRKFYG